MVEALIKTFLRWAIIVILVAGGLYFLCPWRAG